MAGLLLRRSGTLPAAILWGALVTVTGAVASSAWGGAGPGAVCVAGLSVAATCGLPIWLAFPLPRPESGTAAGSN